MSTDRNFGPPDLNPLITGAEGIPRPGGRTKALVLKDTEAMLGKPREYYGGDVFSKLGEGADPYTNKFDKNDTGTNLQYPRNLGTKDAQNFMLFKIYNGHSSAYYDTEREVQELAFAQGLLDDANDTTFWQGEPTEESADYQRLMEGGPVTLSSGKRVFFRLNENTGQYEANVIPPEGEIGTSVPLDIEMGKAKKTYDELTDEETNSFLGIETGTKRKPKTIKQARSSRVRKANVRQKQTIAIYMPQKLNVANFNTYDTPNFALLNQIGGALTSPIAAGLPIAKRKLAEGADQLASVFGAELNANSFIDSVTGKVENPRKETVYQSPELRKFEFSFEFTPRNLDESKSLWDIIRTFKHHAYPSLAGGGYFFNMPAEFELQYYSIINGTAYENVWLNKIARCVLQEINLDYTAAGMVSTFNNGAPTNVNMTLTFQEVELITQEKVDQGY